MSRLHHENVAQNLGLLLSTHIHRAVVADRRPLLRLFVHSLRAVFAAPRPTFMATFPAVPGRARPSAASIILTRIRTADSAGARLNISLSLTAGSGSVVDGVTPGMMAISAGGG